MPSHTREFIVGIVFLAMLGVLAVITLVIGADALHQTHEVKFRFEDVAGLKEGSEVWLNGLPSGQVKSIAIAPDGVVEATATMKTDLAGIEMGGGATVAVKSKSALGGAIVSLETRKEEGKTTLQEVLGTTWKSKKESFEAVGDKIGEVTGEVKSLLKDAREGTGLLAKLIRDPKVAEDFSTMLANFRQASDDVAQGTGTLGRLVKDDSLYRRAEEAVAGLERITKSANEGEGLFGRLLKDKTLADRFDRMTRDLEALVSDARAGKGTLGRLLTDDALYEEMRRAVADLSAFTQQVNAGDGLLHQLAYDKGMGDDFRATMADLRGVFGDLRSGKGTVGKLMQDEALYKDLRDAVRSLQRSFEEARENAPILTFAGFLFKTF